MWIGSATYPTESVGEIGEDYVGVSRAGVWNTYLGGNGRQTA
jgi:hypothetical protein